MRKKIVWSAISSLMIASLILMSCGPSGNVAETTTGPAVDVPDEGGSQTQQPTQTPEENQTPGQGQQEEQQQQEPVASTGPQYGGTMTVIAALEPQAKLESRSWLAYEHMMGTNWLRGPAGSGVTDFAAGGQAIEDNMGPLVMESWETPEQGVWVMQLRQGVHWQNTGTPAGNMLGGREVTADDIVDSFNWQLHESGNKGWIHVGQRAVADAATIEKTGPMEVTIRTPIDFLTAWTWIIWGAGYFSVKPAEVGIAFGHALEFRNNDVPFDEVVGTGPYIIEDAVTSSSNTWRKNPDYYLTDPVGPGKGNPLPYIDRVTELWLPDRSTQLAAFRTGKVAYMPNMTKEEFDTEQRLHPEIEYTKFLNQTTQTRFIMMDTRKAPYNDIRVRQALMMATDFNAIKDGFYGGDAEIDVWPLNSNFATSGYIPLDEMPQDIQDLYTYNPDRAKELLAEAGYPDGFTAKISMTVVGTDADEVSIFKDMWAKVGVDLQLNVMENLQFTNMWKARDYEDMIYRYMWTTWPMMFYFSSDRGASTNNLSFINDPTQGTADETVENAFNAVNDDMIVNMEGVYQTMRDLRIYLMRQAHVIPRPTPYLYTAWWPWLENYYGFGNISEVFMYQWIDKGMREEMGH